jgi:antitoxin Phd
MKINSENLVSVTEANQNFSKVAKQVDEKGSVIILKNNTPKYVLIEYSSVENSYKKEDIELVALDIINRHRKAYEELAK